MQKFATNETGSLLWYLFSHATSDAVKVTALSVSDKLHFCTHYSTLFIFGFVIYSF